MELGLSGKVAMVAAASKGLGLAIAQELAAEGCRVSICARNEPDLKQASQAIPGSHATPTDVTDPASLAAWHKATVERFGAVDILVTNTGGPPAGKQTMGDRGIAFFETMSALINAFYLAFSKQFLFSLLQVGRLNAHELFAIRPFVTGILISEEFACPRKNFGCTYVVCF